MISLSSKLVVSAFLIIWTAFFLLTGCSKSAAGQETAVSTDKIFTVRKSDLMINTLLTGTVNAKKNYKLALEASMDTNLNWIVEENAHVKAGDIVIKFEKEGLIQKIENTQYDVDSIQKNIQIQQQNKIILESEIKANLREASDRVIMSEEALSRYLKYDGKKQRDTKELAVDNAEKAYKDAKAAELKKASEIVNKIYDNDAAKDNDQSKLEQLEQTTKTRKNVYSNAALDLKVFKRYTHPNKVTELQNKLAQAKLNMQRVEIAAKSKMNQKNNEIVKQELNYKKATRELLKQESYLPLLEITAPVDGSFIYGDVNKKYGKQDIKIGMHVRRKQILATIPDMNNLIIDFELPEEFRHKIQLDAATIISPTSLPSLKINGNVSEIALVPVNQINWDATSPKIYKSKIELEQQHVDLVSGMSVQVEVILDTVKDSINIPVEAVFEEEGQFFVYKKNGNQSQKQIVELGKSNDRYVDIITGLMEGEDVYLYRPFEQSKSE